MVVEISVVVVEISVVVVGGISVGVVDGISVEVVDGISVEVVVDEICIGVVDENILVDGNALGVEDTGGLDQKPRVGEILESSTLDSGVRSVCVELVDEISGASGTSVS